MENMLKDIRYGFRMLVKSPGFTTVAVLSLALGIGANTAIFSIISAVLFAPLPVEEPSRLVSIFTTDAKNPGNLPVSHYNSLDYREKNDVFTGVFSYNFAAVNLNKGAGETKQVFGLVVSGNYFDVLGVKPLYGRTFLPDEDKTPSTHPVVVLGYGCWQRDFGGDPQIVGQNISLNRRDFSVIGIAPKDFKGTDIGGEPDFWAPMMMHNELQPDMAMFYDGRRGLAFNLVGRLKPGVTLQEAQASLSQLASQLEQEYRTDNEGRNVKLVPLLQARVDPGGDGQLMFTSMLLMGIVGIILLIACANVMNLLLARATRRRREIAIRLAIGASRGRLIKQLMTESLTLSFVGGAIGFLVAYWTKDLITSFVPFGGGPNAAATGLNLQVLAFAFTISVASGVMFGLVPAIQASKPDLVPTLKGEITMSVGERLFGSDIVKSLAVWLRKGLVVFQVALSLFALITAGLFVRSLQKASQVNPGFVSDNVLLMGFNLGREGYSQAQGKQFHRQLLERVQAMPGVRFATIARNRPFGGGFARSVFIEGQEPPPGGRGVLVQTNVIGQRFFDTLGVPLIKGRDFTDADAENAPMVVIINETMANRFWPNQDAVGKRFKFFGDQNYREVVAIASDSKVNSLTEQRTPYVYIPLSQEYSPQITLEVSTLADPRGMVAALRSEVQGIDPNLSVLNVQTLNDRVNGSLQGARSQVSLLSTAGLLALLLASIGLYGVMAYSVAQRTREIGIRMALGASRKDMFALVLKQGAALVAVGVAAGLAGAYGVFFFFTRLVSTQLFGVTAADPLTYAGTSALLVVVALLATYFPARRATKVDPMVALRYE